MAPPAFVNGDWAYLRSEELSTNLQPEGVQLVLASSVLMAIREAIASFRRDAGLTDFFELNPPCTTEAVLGLLAPAHAALKRPVFKK